MTTNTDLLRELAKLVRKLQEDNRDLKRENRRINKDMNMVMGRHYDLVRGIKSAIDLRALIDVLHSI